MDLEELNRTQIVLLTLLVSFVTSIATGIVTVALMSQTPPAVTQTINHVVERTVERVVPASVTDANSGNSSPSVTKETTVVVKEDDLITESIAKNKEIIVRLVTPNASASTGAAEIAASGTSTASSTDQIDMADYTFRGMGVVVSSGGLVSTAASVADNPGLIAVTSNGVGYKTTLVTSDNSIALLKLVPNTEDGTVSLKAAKFANTANLKLGQTVIALGGEDRTSVGIGIIASLIPGDATTTPQLKEVQTNVQNVTAGSPLVNIFGEIVGIRGDSPKEEDIFTSGDVMKASMSAALAPTSGTVGSTNATGTSATAGNS